MIVAAHALAPVNVAVELFDVLKHCHSQFFLDVFLAVLGSFDELGVVVFVDLCFAAEDRRDLPLGDLSRFKSHVTF